MNIKIIFILSLVSVALLGCKPVAKQPLSWEQQNKIAIEDFKHAKPNPCFVQNKGAECYQHLAEQDKVKQLPKQP